MNIDSLVPLLAKGYFIIAIFFDSLQAMVCLVRLNEMFSLVNNGIKQFHCLPIFFGAPQRLFINRLKS